MPCLSCVNPLDLSTVRRDEEERCLVDIPAVVVFPLSISVEISPHGYLLVNISVPYRIVPSQSTLCDIITGCQTR